MGMISVVKNIPRVLKRGVGKTLFKLDKNKPQLLVGTGVVLMVGGFIWAIVNARKIDEVIAEGENAVNDIQDKITEAKFDVKTDENEKTTAISILEKDLRKAKVNNITRMGVLMGIPCLMFAGGLSLTIGGHILLVRRFGELSTAFAWLQQSYERYRQMNIAEHGEECDKRYRYGITDQVEVETPGTDDNGNEQNVKCLVPVTGRDPASMYTFIFSPETSRRCPKDPVSTISYLRSQEKYWNMWMQANNRPVTLYMIIEELGIEIDTNNPANDYILIVGWRPNGDGDNHIDFGIMRAVNKPTLDMIENSVMLNFNCDGNIYESARYDENGRKVN